MTDTILASEKQPYYIQYIFKVIKLKGPER